MTVWLKFSAEILQSEDGAVTDGLTCRPWGVLVLGGMALLPSMGSLWWW